MTQRSGQPKLVASSDGRQVKSESHLHSHGHLTNNIHLRNLIHMQRHRILMEARNSSELPLMKELTILRRARSLRDPSTSPAWSNSSSYGSRRLQGNIKRGDEAREMKHAGSDARRDLRKLNLRDTAIGSKREKLDLRAGGQHWVGEFIGQEALHQESVGSDQKENNVLKSNGIRDAYVNHHGIEVREVKSKSGNIKKGRRLEKSRSYPRIGSGFTEADEQSKSQRKSGRSLNQHSERENIPKGSSFEERVGETARAEDDRLHRGSICAVESDWVEEPERRAEIARRVISESVKGEARADSEAQPSSPVFTIRSGHSHREHSDRMSVMGLMEHESEKETRKGYGDSEEDEISLRNGLKQLQSSLSSHTHSPLLYRDSMMTNATERTTPRARRKPHKGAGSRDGERRHREGINVRVMAKPQGRLRGRRSSSLRPSLPPGNGSGFGMEGELDVSELPRNGCGIPWYWTRMHKYRGRRFLDLAGRSLACGFTDGSKRKDNKQCRSNSHLSETFDRSCVFAARSSDFEQGSRFEGDGRESPVIPRADGDLLTADASGELVFGSTREDLSGILVPASPAYGDESPGPPLSILPPDEEQSNLSLSEKYRPRSFNDLVGQTMVTKSLSNAVLKGKVASIYLFQGPPGTGKTSCARIFTRALNCVSENLDVTRPCGFCTECCNSSPDMREFDASSNDGVHSVNALLGSMLATPSTSCYRVFIINDCHLLTAEAWNAFLKALEKPPRQVVFILITTDPDKIPRAAITRCQKFLFSKIKELDIVNRLQILARQENVEIEEAAFAVVAARSQGSLRDAETTLEQLCLLGRKVSLSMVQEMAGLVSDEKLIDLLDLAMSAEAVSTVRCMRDLLEGGVEPLALVSQLATLITDILAGTYVVSREKLMKGLFFRRNGRKEEALRLKQALKILSEAEKQLRFSSDQPTWLTAALLQFAPDRSFQPSSLETSVVASPAAAFNDTSEKETVGDSVQPWTSQEQIQFHPEDTKGENVSRRDQVYSLNFPDRRKKNGTSGYVEAKIHPAESPVVVGLGTPNDRGLGRPSNAKSDTPLLPGTIDDLNQREFTLISQRKLEEVWERVIQGSRSNVLRQLLQGQGKLLSLLLSDAFAVAHLEFRHPEHKARAERSRSRICNGFQMALGCPVELQITLACMPGEQQISFTSFDDQPQLFDGWYKEKEKFNLSTMRSSSSLNRRRQRNVKPQRTFQSMDIPQSLYNAVMGDSKGFKPEILPVVSSSRWGRLGGPTDSRHEHDRSERPGETRKFSSPSSQNLRYSEHQRTRYGPNPVSRTVPKIPLKTAIHQYEHDQASPSQHFQTDVLCGSSSRKKTVKFRDVNSGHSASLELENLRLESRHKPSQTESRLLCWRVQKLDEEKIKVQRRRRQRRVMTMSSSSIDLCYSSSATVKDCGRSCLSSVREKLLRSKYEQEPPLDNGNWGFHGPSSNAVVVDIASDEGRLRFSYNESYNGSSSSD